MLSVTARSLFVEPDVPSRLRSSPFAWISLCRRLPASACGSYADRPISRQAGREGAGTGFGMTRAFRRTAAGEIGQSIVSLYNQAGRHVDKSNAVRCFTGFADSNDESDRCPFRNNHRDDEVQSVDKIGLRIFVEVKK